MSKDCKDEAQAKAYVSFSGQLLECNSEFLRISGLSEREVPLTSLTSLVKHKNPESVLESAYLLDQLCSDSKSQRAEFWRAELGVGSEIKHEDFEIVAKLSTVKIKGQSVLEATIQAAHAAAPGKSHSFLTREQSEEINFFVPQRVLIVEDSPTSLKMMARMVQKLGHIVNTAIDGEKALEQLETETFDIVLMDINMPHMNGLQASHEFRKIEKQRQKQHPGQPSLKIIAMSADISNTLFHEVTNAGFDAFIPKPLTVESFKEVLKMPTK